MDTSWTALQFGHYVGVLIQLPKEKDQGVLAEPDKLGDGVVPKKY